MSKYHFWPARATGYALAALVILWSDSLTAQVQRPGSNLRFKVQAPTQQLEMIVNTSRILKLDKKIPKVFVNNKEIVRLQMLSADQIQVVALRTGVTQINIYDENEQIYTVEVSVHGDAQELQMILKNLFPRATLKVRPLASSVLISGFVDQPEMVSRIIQTAEDYYPRVINNITVGGVQQVLLHVKVIEVSRSKLREFGFDWTNINANDFVVSSVSGLISSSSVSDLFDGAATNGVATGGGDTLRFGIVDGANSFFGFLEALRRYNLAKLLAEPTLVTVSGRPARFYSGGAFPILVPQSLGTVSIEYREFGTKIDFVPIVLGNGKIRLEVRPEVSERDDAGGIGGVPAIRTRSVDTAVEMKAGQTLALAGLIQTRVESENRGLPFIADIPWVGGLFRRVDHSYNEIELLILVTPQIVEAMDSHEVPACLPGQSTTGPTDGELYGRGYLEVPKCCEDRSCANCQAGGGRSEELRMPGHGGLPYEQVQPGPTSPPSPPRKDAAYRRGTAPRWSTTHVTGPTIISPPAQGISRRRTKVTFSNTNLSKTNSPGSGPARSDLYVRNNPPQEQSSSQPSQKNSRPGLIGPTGYDVLK